MRLSLLVYIAVFIFSSCNDDDNESGEPCTYDEKILPATLVRLEKIDSLRFDAVFTIEYPAIKEGQDSIRYSILNNGYYINAGEVIFDSLAVGKKYQYITQTIKSGSCNPNIDMLLLKPYAEK